MIVKFLDRAREVPWEEADLAGYVTVAHAANETGLEQVAITNAVHHSRKVASAVFGNSRLVRLQDVKELAGQ